MAIPSGVGGVVARAFVEVVTGDQTSLCAGQQNQPCSTLICLTLRATFQMHTSIPSGLENTGFHHPRRGKPDKSAF